MIHFVYVFTATNEMEMNENRALSNIKYFFSNPIKNTSQA